MWWDAAPADFIPSSTAGSIISGLGKLDNSKTQELRRSVESVVARAKSYEARTQKKIPPLPSSIMAMTHALTRLESIATSFREMVFGITEVQRYFREITGMLDYMEIYKPRMDGEDVPASNLANAIGAFTTEVRVAQDFVVAGLPVWLIRPASAFDDQNILAVVTPMSPDKCLVVGKCNPEFPVIFSGDGCDLKKFEVIHQYSRHFLRYPDPFNHVPSCASLPSSPSHPSSPSVPVANSSHNVLPEPTAEAIPHGKLKANIRSTKNLKRSFQPCEFQFSLSIQIRVLMYCHRLQISPWVIGP